MKTREEYIKEHEEKQLKRASRVPGLQEHISKRVQELKDSGLFKNLMVERVGTSFETDGIRRELWFGAYSIHSDASYRLINETRGISIVGVYDDEKYGEDIVIDSPEPFGTGTCGEGGLLEVLKEPDTITVKGETLIAPKHESARISVVSLQFDRKKLSNQGYIGQENPIYKIEEKKFESYI